MKTNKRPIPWAIVGGFLIAVLVGCTGLVGYVVLDVLYLAEWREKRGDTPSGAQYKWRDAMNRGDANEAKYWAGRVVEMTSGDYPIPDAHSRAYCYLAEAHELAGELEEALRLYENEARYETYTRYEIQAFSRSAAARVYFKLGQEADAFHAFCEFAMEMRRRFKTPGDEPIGLNRTGIIRDEIVGGSSGPFTYKQTLRPFPDYNAFMLFMEREWEELDNDAQYREAMEFLRAVANPSKPENGTEARKRSQKTGQV